jgi:hypothetical protein
LPEKFRDKLKEYLMSLRNRAIISALVAMALLAVEMAWNIIPADINIGLAIAVVVLVLNLAISEIELNKIKSTIPNLVFTEPYVKKYSMTEFRHKTDDSQSMVAGTATVTVSYTPGLRDIGSTDNYEDVTESYLIAFALVENKKEQNKEVVTSLSTHAVLDFFKEDTTIIRKGVDARWADTKEPSYTWLNPTEESYYLQKDIPAGTTEKLCLVTRREKGGDCYIFNLETYQGNKVERKELLIGKGLFFVKIIVRNANPTNDLEGWFEIKNFGEKNDLQIRRIEKPAAF